MQISNEAKARLIEILDRRRRRRPEDAPRPIPAAAIAKWLGLPGHRETQRRSVRGLIKGMRDDGRVPIMSNLKGYWMGECQADHAAYQQFRRSIGLASLAAAAEDRRTQAQADADGQLGLFPDTGPSRNHI